MFGQFPQHRRRQGRHIGTDLCGIGHMIHSADRGRKDLRREAVIVIDLANVRNQLHAVEADIIQPPDKGRDEGRARLGCKQRLVGGETEGDIHHMPITGEHPASPQPGPCQRHLDGNIRRDLRQSTPFGDHFIRLDRRDLGRDRAVDNFADLLRDFHEITARFHDQ